MRGVLKQGIVAEAICRPDRIPDSPLAKAWPDRSPMHASASKKRMLDKQRETLKSFMAPPIEFHVQA